MKKIKSFTLIYVISVLCITQVKAQSSSIADQIPNQLDSLIRESIIMSHNFYPLNNEYRKPYFIIKDGIPNSFDIDSLAKELGVQVITFGELYRNRVMGNYTKPNGKVIAKNFAKYFRGNITEETGGRFTMGITDIIVDNIYIYIYIYISMPILRKISTRWYSSLSSSTMNRYCYEYSPKEKKWNLVDIVNSSDRRVPLPNKKIQ